MEKKHTFFRAVALAAVFVAIGKCLRYRVRNGEPSLAQHWRKFHGSEGEAMAKRWHKFHGPKPPWIGEWDEASAQEGGNVATTAAPEAAAA